MNWIHLVAFYQMDMFVDFTFAMRKKNIRWNPSEMFRGFLILKKIVVFISMRSKRIGWHHCWIMRRMRLKFFHFFNSTRLFGSSLILFFWFSCFNDPNVIFLSACFHWLCVVFFFLLSRLLQLLALYYSLLVFCCGLAVDSTF